MSKKMKRIPLFVAAAILLVSCNGNKNDFDASGTFEAVETIIPAEANGVLKAYTVDEGQVLKAGQYVGYIDSIQIYLKKRQLEAQIGAVLSKRPDAGAQLAAIQEQLTHDKKEQDRVTSLHQADAATDRQLDDINAKVIIDEKRIAALESSLHITTSSIREATSPILLQIAQLNDQLEKCRLVNPIDGTVLVNYVEPHEMAVVGKPLYKIADLRTILLRAYITGDQFAQVRPRQQVTVLADDGHGAYRKYKGVVEWISDKAEFTPKTIQTKDERAQLVYAMKIRVKNDGHLKIGMYGAVRFGQNAGGKTRPEGD